MMKNFKGEIIYGEKDGNFVMIKNGKLPKGYKQISKEDGEAIKNKIDEDYDNLQKGIPITSLTE